MTQEVPMSSAAPDMKWARRLATALVVTAFLMEAAALILLVPNTALPSFAPLGFFGGTAYAFGVAFAAAGWLIVSRSPANRIGWLLLLVGWLSAVVPLIAQYATYGLIGHPGALPLAEIAAWVYAWGYLPGFLLFFPTLLLFPDGRLPSRRWRWVLWALGVTALLMLPALMIGTWPHRGADLMLRTSSPTTIFEAEAPLLALLAGLGNILILPIACASLVGIGVRFRRSSGVERQQLKLFVAAAVLTILLLYVGGILVLIPAPFDTPAGVAVGALLPVAVGIAVLRYRLYEIDVVIRRTLVYVPLTALLAGVYAATIGVSQRVFVAVIGQESDGAVILSTLLVAATFAPIKNALQARVDRSFRDVTDAERRLLAFTEAIHDLPARPDPERTLRLFLKSAVGAVGAGGGEAWLETAAGELSAGATPARTPGPKVDVPIDLDGRRFGRLELDARPRGGSFSARDLASLDLAAGRLGLALGAQQAGDA
jgi:hypothetical protein